MYEEIKAIYSRKNKVLTLSFFDKEDQLIVQASVPKLISYKVGEEVDGINHNKYIVVDVKDEIFNPKKLHTAIMVKKDA